MAAAAAGEPVTVYGDGHQTRDFVYVGDVVQAIVRALQRPLNGVSTLNVGSGTPTSVLDVLGRLEQLAGGPIERRFAAARVGDIRHSRADAGRAGWVLGWKAGETFAGGLEKTWAWYREGPRA
jgi:UDP-glucose 4-epimerase